MQVVYLLNESRDPNVTGDFMIFASLDALVSYVEAIDVLNSEYFAHTSDGRRIALLAHQGGGDVTYSIDNDQDCSEQVRLLLLQYLSCLRTSIAFSGTEISASPHSTLPDLVAQIPSEAIVS